MQNSISINEAHELSKSDKTLFPYLIQMQSSGIKYGIHSFDDALKYQCLKKVNVINDLHEESDQIRFQILDKLNAAEIYTLMVYSENEIYTSTFLGMYKRLIDKSEFSIITIVIVLYLFLARNELQIYFIIMKEHDFLKGRTQIIIGDVKALCDIISSLFLVIPFCTSFKGESARSSF